jgi:hypothetical protein
MGIPDELNYQWAMVSNLHEIKAIQPKFDRMNNKTPFLTAVGMKDPC